MNDVPIVIKHGTEEEAWLEDEPFFYMVADNGVFTCRNHPFYRSITRMRDGIGLKYQQELLYHQFPKIPAAHFSKILGFFKAAYEEGGEAAVLFAFNKKTEKVHLIVPEQIAGYALSTMSSLRDKFKTWRLGVWEEPEDSPTEEEMEGCKEKRHASNLKYSSPVDLPSHMIIFGDIHSHADMGAFASGVDTHDEVHRAGLHLVVGKFPDKLDYHAAAVVDGVRFRMDPFFELIEGVESFEHLRLITPGDFPKRWMKRISFVKEQWLPPHKKEDALPLGNAYDLL